MYQILNGSMLFPTVSFDLTLSQLPPFPPSGQQAVFASTLYLFPLCHRGSQFPACCNDAKASPVPHLP